ncbi:S8 family serine peptidase [Fulvivirga sp.]|uniref:S8 family serine peptidase n=1 Tax=Fulvivirga sp. TaxID=1931237 RepID=UPI0032F017C4
MRSWSYRIFTLFVFSIAFASLSYSQTKEDYLDKLVVSKSGLNSRLNKGVWLVEINDQTKLHALREAGFNIKRRLTNNLFIIENTQVKTTELLFNNFWAVNDQWKLSDQLLFGSQWPQELTVQVLDNNHVSDSWKQIGGKTYTVNAKSIKDRPAFLSNSNILYVGIEFNNAKTETRVLDMNLNPNRINAIHTQYPTLDGQSIVVSIKEQAFNDTDIDLVGRTVDSDLKSPDQDNHATEMATIIAGAGNSFVTGRGVAKQAKITSSNFENVFPDENTDYQELNVSVQNHSYGTEIENLYGTKAMGFDQSANDNKQLLHVFSSGNQGEATSESGDYSGIAGYANLTGNFKMAKNVLVVGSVDTVNNVPFFVSVGPAYDGRIKPEVVAYSAVGSSNSAALVSGLTALVQEKYLEMNGVLPTSALVKSVLINTADDIGTAGPDFKTGYGNVNGLKSIEAIASGQHFESTVSQGESQGFNIDLPANVSQLKITLVWNDPAAEVNASKALVNDLDLTVTSDEGTYQPWVLDASASKESLALPAQKGADHTNNIEQVVVDNPAEGSYGITIEGFDVPQGPQSFAITYSYELSDQFVWTSPSAGDNMPYNGETAGYLRWEISFAGTGMLEYSMDNGNTWALIGDNVNLKRERYRWNTEDLIGPAKVRMVINGASYETEIFSLSKTLRSSIGFNCGDSVLLQWSKDPKAQSYQLSSFDEGPYLEYFTTIADTSLVVYKANGITKYSVKPIYENGFLGIGSETFDYDQLGTNCYSNGFVAEIEDDRIKLTAYLALTYGVKEIGFVRLNDTNPWYLNIAVGSLMEIVVYDEQPEEGWNEYRAIIKFDNGETLLSEVIRIYYFSTTLAFVFPNPAEADDFLVVYTKDFEGAALKFRLISRTGQLILEESLYSDINDVAIPNIEDGLYLYQIETPEGMASGRIIIQQSR